PGRELLPDALSATLGERVADVMKHVPGGTQPRHALDFTVNAPLPAGRPQFVRRYRAIAHEVGRQGFVVNHAQGAAGATDHLQPEHIILVTDHRELRRTEFARVD